MKTSGVSSSGELKTSGGIAFVEAIAADGMAGRSGGLAFVEEAVAAGASVGGMSRSHAARNDAARTDKDVFRKSRREE
jgi:hypothetical protein